MKRTLLLPAFLLFSTLIYAQNGLFLTGGFTLCSMGAHMEKRGTVLQHSLADSGIMIMAGNLCGNIQFRYKRFSFEVGYHGNEFGSQNFDMNYLKRHPENYEILTKGNPLNYQTKMCMDIYYTSLSGTISYYIPMEKERKPHNYFYFSLGTSRNFLRGPNKGTREFYDAANEELLHLEYTCARDYWGLVAEAGWNWVGDNHKNRWTYYLGGTFTTGFEHIIMASYSDTQRDLVINTDHVYSNGCIGGMVFRFGFNCAPLNGRTYKSSTNRSNKHIKTIKKGPTQHNKTKSGGSSSRF